MEIVLSDDERKAIEEARRSEVELAGLAANQAAAKHSFGDFRSRRSQNTLKAHDGDLRLFRETLVELALELPSDLNSNPMGWHGVSWGLVSAFVKLLLERGYAVSSINRALLSVKSYAKLAFQAGVLDEAQHALIRTVTGYGHKEARHIDEKRAQTRRDFPGAKKAGHTTVSDEQAEMLKQQPDTPQGRRDTVLMCLLLNQGLRCGEVAALKVWDVQGNTLTFYRAKVDLVQTHELSAETLDALERWFESGDAPVMVDAPLLRASRKGGRLTEAGMSERAITGRVQVLGEKIGIEGLSAHDCRHYWATYWANRVDRLPRGVFTLQEAGGWSSLVMPCRYVEEARIANQGMGS